MENKLITESGVTGYIDENGTAQLKLENIAKGLGFTQTAASGNEVVRWERVKKYLQEFEFIPTSGDGIASICDEKLPEFIPENIFYRLAFKASNKTAVDFQCKVADDILPAIRKRGFYGTPATIDSMLSNPDTAIKMLQEYKAEKEGRLAAEVRVKELAPKAAYVDAILNNPGLMTITQISKDYGMSGTEMNKLLHEYGVQYKQSRQWLLYVKYQACGYVHSKTVKITHKDGTPDVTVETKWTSKGRMFIYQLLKDKGLLPVIERQKLA